MTRLRALPRRLRGLATWQVAGPIAAYVIVALLVALFLGLFVALHDSSQRAIDSRQAATRRIDQLQRQIVVLQDRLRHTSIRDARKIGRLEDAIAALTAQIRQMGGRPVTVGEPSPAPQPTPAASSSSTSSPRPHPSGHPTGHPTGSPTVTPTPSPTSTCVRLLGQRVCLNLTPQEGQRP